MDLWPETLRVAGGIESKLILKYYNYVVKVFMIIQKKFNNLKSLKNQF